MRLRPWQVSARSLVLAAALCAAAVLSLLELTNGLTPRGVVHGSVHRCGVSPVVNNDACYLRRGYEPVAGAKLQFVRSDDRVVFTAITDSLGSYSVSLPAGHYVVPGYFDGGPRELTVIGGQRVEADYQIWRLPL